MEGNGGKRDRVTKTDKREKSWTDGELEGGGRSGQLPPPRTRRRSGAFCAVATMTSNLPAAIDLEAVPMVQAAGPVRFPIVSSSHLGLG